MAMDGDLSLEIYLNESLSMLQIKHVIDSMP